MKRVAATPTAPAAELVWGVPYRTPSGRRCFLEALDHVQSNVAHFTYANAEGKATRSNMAEGFSLTRSNFGILVRLLP